MAIQPFGPGPGQYIQNAVYNPAMQQMIVPAKTTSMFAEILSLAGPIAQAVGAYANAQTQIEQNKERAKQESEKRIFEEAQRQYTSYRRQLQDEGVQPEEEAKLLAKESRRFSEMLPTAQSRQAFAQLDVEWTNSYNRIFNQRIAEEQKAAIKNQEETVANQKQYLLYQAEFGNMAPQQLFELMDKINPNLKNDSNLIGDMQRFINARNKAAEADLKQARDAERQFLTKTMQNVQDGAELFIKNVEESIYSNQPVQLYSDQPAVLNPDADSVMRAVDFQITDLLLAAGQEVEDDGLPADPELRNTAIKLRNYTQGKILKTFQDITDKQNTANARISLTSAFQSGNAEIVKETLNEFLNSTVGKKDVLDNYKLLNDVVKSSLNSLRDSVMTERINPVQFDSMASTAQEWATNNNVVWDVGNEFADTYRGSITAAIDVINRTTIESFNKEGTVLTLKAYYSAVDSRGISNLFKLTVQHLYETGQIDKASAALAMKEGTLGALITSAPSEYLKQYFTAVSEYIDKNVDDELDLRSPKNFVNPNTMLINSSGRANAAASIGVERSNFENLWNNNNPDLDVSRIQTAQLLANSYASMTRGYNAGKDLVTPIINGLKSTNRLERATAIMQIKSLGGLGHPAFQEYMNSQQEDDTGMQLLITAASIPKMSGPVVDFGGTQLTSSGDWFSALDSVMTATSSNFQVPQKGFSKANPYNIFNLPETVAINSGQFQSLSEMYQFFYNRLGDDNLANNAVKEWLRSSGMAFVYNKSDNNLVMVADSFNDVIPHTEFSFNGRDYENQDQFIKDFLSSTITPVQFPSYNSFFNLADSSRAISSKNPEPIWKFIVSSIRDKFGMSASDDINDFEFAVMYDQDSEYRKDFRSNLEDLPSNYSPSRRFGDGGGILVAKLKGQNDWVRLTQANGSPLRIGQHSAYMDFNITPTEITPTETKTLYPAGY